MAGRLHYQYAPCLDHVTNMTGKSTKALADVSCPICKAYITEATISRRLCAYCGAVMKGDDQVQWCPHCTRDLWQ